jgi:transposase-like protein
MPRLTKEQRQELEELLLKGEHTQKELAERFNVSQPAVSRVKRLLNKALEAAKEDMAVSEPRNEESPAVDETETSQVSSGSSPLFTMPVTETTAQLFDSEEQQDN